MRGPCARDLRRFTTVKTADRELASNRLFPLGCFWPLKLLGIGGFLFAVSEGEDCITESDPRLRVATMDTMTVQADGQLPFRYKNSSTINA